MMTHKDLGEVLEIERVSFAAPWSHNMFVEELSNRSARLLVFMDGDRVAGYMCFWEVLDEAHLLTIAVHPEKRGRGFGEFMMAYLEQICAKDGLKRIVLDVGRRNEAARSLYRRRGFLSIGFRKDYYTVIGDDAIVMEKWLGPGERQEQAGQGAERL